MIVAGLAWAYGLPRPRIRRPRGRAAVIAGVLAVLLALPILAAISKAVYGLILFLTPNAHLWGGDFFTFFSPSAFVGTSAGVAGALAVLIVACLALTRLLTRREAIVLGAVFVLCVLFDVRLRLSDRGNYMDFKHLGYVGAFVLSFAAAGVVAAVLSRRRVLVVAGIALGLAWFVPAVIRIRDETGPTLQQVSVTMFQLRDWSAKLPKDASIRLDIPPSGYQLWAQYLLYRHPLDAPYPVVKTTYAHVPWGVTADYVLTPRYVYGKRFVKWPRPPYTDAKP